MDTVCIDALVCHKERRSFFYPSFCYFTQLWIFLLLPQTETIKQIESLSCKLPSVNRAPYPAGLLISDPVVINPCLAQLLTLKQRI